MIKGLILLSFALLFQNYLSAQVNNNLTFADKLYEEKEYYRAITEYKRFLYLYGTSIDDSINVLQKIVLCDFKGENYSDALNETNKLLNLSKVSEGQYIKWNAIRGLNFLKMNYSESAYDVFQSLNDKDYQYFFLGVANLYKYEWDSANVYLNKVGIPATGSVLELKQELMEISIKGQSLPYKSPLLAGILSGILPGAGYVYAGKYQTAFSSLLINSLLIGSTIELNKKGYKFVSGATLLLSFGWYFGNIMGSYDAVETSNNHMSEGVVNPVLERLGEFLFR
jgi:hypothetical protein